MDVVARKTVVSSQMLEVNRTLDALEGRRLILPQADEQRPAGTRSDLY